MLQRSQNERLILGLLWQHGAMAKAEIARETGLSAQTASVLMRQLEDDGIIMRRDPVRGQVGQPKVPMAVATGGAYFFGIKAGRRNADLILIDFSGQVLARKSTTYRFPDPRVLVDFATAGFDEVMATLSEAQRARVAGIGLAVSFKFWDWAAPLGVPQQSMDPWREVDLEAEISARTGIPVIVENDMSAACGAELVFGETQEVSHFVYFYLGYFIGGGVVLNRALYTGPTGNAGALGSMLVCEDGRIRPLIEMASLSVLEMRLIEHGLDASALWCAPDDWDFEAQIVETWLERAAKGLAQAIVSATATLDCRAAMIDGWIPVWLRERLVSAVQAELERLNASGIDMPDVRAGSVGRDARAIGAASLPLSRCFLEP